MSESTCQNCRARVVSYNGYAGETWTHQPAGSSFMDNTYDWCHLKRAEPAAATPPTTVPASGAGAEREDG